MLRCCWGAAEVGESTLVKEEWLEKVASVGGEVAARWRPGENG